MNTHTETHSFPGSSELEGCCATCAGQDSSAGQGWTGQGFDGSKLLTSVAAVAVRG